MKKKKPRTTSTIIKNPDQNPSQVNNSNNISSLPTTILTEIFIRFPISQLMNFKLVCKSWYTLISNPIFTDIYTKNPPFTTLLLPMPCQLIYLLEISPTGKCTKTHIRPRLPRWLQRDGSEFVIGSCNGLVSFSMQRDGNEVVYVSNPMLGEYIELPLHESEVGDKTFAMYRIGFCEGGNKFKVLRIGYRSWADSRVEECEIFTVGVDDKWRRLDNPFTRLLFWADGVCVNGAFHWILPDDEGFYRICSFDLAEEKEGWIANPEGLVLCSMMMSLYLFEGRLCLVDGSVESCITIWTMREYGVGESWTKDVVLRGSFPSGMSVSGLVGKLLNGDLLFGSNADLILFNAEQNKCLNIGFFGVPMVASRIIPYTPSFKSLSNALMRGGTWDSLNS